MFQAILSFLGHDGIRLLFFLFVIIGNVVKSRAKVAKQNEAKLRGGTAIRDFSTPADPPAATPFSSDSTAAPKSAALKPAARPIDPAPRAAGAPPEPLNSNAKPPAAPPGSPWSSNQNPFN